MAWTFEKKGKIDEVVMELNMNPEYESMPGVMKHNLRQILHQFPSTSIMNVVCFGDMNTEIGAGEVNIQITVEPPVQETVSAEPETQPEQAATQELQPVGQEIDAESGDSKNDPMDTWEKRQ